MNWHPINDSTKFPKGDFLVRDATGHVAVAAYWGWNPGDEELRVSGLGSCDGVCCEGMFTGVPIEWALIPS